MLTSSDTRGHWEDGIMATALLAVIPHNRFLGNVFRHDTEMY